MAAIPMGPESDPLPLLTTKILVPMPSTGHINRPRLMSKINQGTQGPLTLLLAPPGYGKTTALADWARQTSLSVAWLTLNREDNYLWRFSRYFIYAMQAVNSDLGQDSLEYLQPSTRANSELALTLLVNQIATLPDEIVVVLDDYQVIEDAAIHEGLTFLVAHAPPNLHLVIATRSELALDLAHFRARGWVTEIGPERLRFAVDEVALFIQQTNGLTLPAEDAAALLEKTEGWPAGVQLLSLFAGQQSELGNLVTDPAESRYVFEFIVDEVLNRQPEDVRLFLMRTSYLETLSGPLTEAVAGLDAEDGYGNRMLRRLHHQNLFITPLDEQHSVFRYHRLFAESLQHAQEETDHALIPELHRRAATWFEMHGRLDEAFSHALDSADLDWAADLIGRHAIALSQSGELQFLTLWLSRIPVELVRRRPFLGLAFAYSLIESHQFEAAQLQLDEVERLLEPLGGSDRAGPPDLSRDEREHGRLRGMLAFCRSTMAILSGDLLQAGQFSRSAQENLPEDDPFSQSLVALDQGLQSIFLGDTSQAIETLRQSARIARRSNNLGAQVVLTCQLAEMEALQGHLSQALVTLERTRVLTLRPDGSPLPLSGVVDCMHGEILRERDQLAEARQILERGLKQTRAWWSLSSLQGLVSLARLLQAQGDFAGAQACIDDAERLAFGSESSPWDDTQVAGTAVRMALQRNDMPTAIQWGQKSQWLNSFGTLTREAVPYNIFEYLVLTEARFRYSLGREMGDENELRRALELLRAILPDTQSMSRVTSSIEVLILQSLTEYELGDAEHATPRLLRALSLGEPEGYRRIFLDEGRGLAVLLERCLSEQPDLGSALPSKGYIEGLVKTYQRDTLLGVDHPDSLGPLAAAIRTPEGVLVTLSAREVEVLTLISEGRSNKEIASQLFLSLNTVKRHAYNIFAKLDVKSRTEAVAKARQLGFIP